MSEMSIEMCSDHDTGQLIEALLDDSLAAQCLNIEQYRMRLLTVAIKVLLEGEQA